jgi:hypothetical protein
VVVDMVLGFATMELNVMAVDAHRCQATELWMITQSYSN